MPATARIDFAGSGLMRRKSLPALVIAFGLPAFALAAPSARPRGSTPPSASSPTPAKGSTSKASAPSQKRRKLPAPKPAGPPPSPPSRIVGPIELLRIHVEVAPERVLVTTDLGFARGEWEAGDLRVHVAYGAPGVPLAFEASICARVPGPIVAADPDTCISLPHAIAYRAPSDVAFVLGPPMMAGETIELSGEALDAALSHGSHAILRLRQLRPLPESGASGMRELLLRLGEVRGKPYRLGAIAVTGIESAKLSEIEASLCGIDVEPKKLPILSESSQAKQGDPSATERKGHEDLCVRFKM